eukprot:6489425-Amphidinium_carterae.1
MPEGLFRRSQLSTGKCQRDIQSIVLRMSSCRLNCITWGVFHIFANQHSIAFTGSQSKAAKCLHVRKNEGGGTVRSRVAP